LEKQKQRFANKISRSAEAVLAAIEQGEHFPLSMDYFIDLMRTIFCNNDITPLLKRNGNNHAPLVGVYCMMVPEELIYAAGAVPVRLSGGSYEGSSIGDEIAPRDTCPVVKASIGCTQEGVPSLYEACDVVIVPTTCDSKRKMAEELSRFKTVWAIEVPHIKDEEILLEVWYEQIIILKKNLESLTGNRISRKSLRDAIALIGRAQHQARRLYDYRMGSKPVIFGKDAALAIHSFAFDIASEWTVAMERLNDELSIRCHKGYSVCPENTPRIMLASCPSVFPNWKLPLLIEEMGGIIAVDESCLGDRYLYDPVGTTESTMREMLSALASRYIMPCICPSFSPNEDRLYRLVEMVRAFNIDGIVYHILKGCIIYDFELVRVEDCMKALDIPVVRIETDYNPEDIEQLRTRIEAFIEVLKGKKKGGCED
jgi:benzoyl-CoA reductase/2-hydroxyglutaryl-CoA dehydratase subunit BcrC/BadD/HgdB